MYFMIYYSKQVILFKSENEEFNNLLGLKISTPNYSLKIIKNIKHMDPEIIDSSSDEDDTYINSAAKLKTLKAERVLAEEDSLSTCTVDFCKIDDVSLVMVIKNPVEENEEVHGSNQNNIQTNISEIIEIDDVSYSSIDQTNLPSPRRGPQTRSKVRKSAKMMTNNVRTVTDTPVAILDLSLEAVDTSFYFNDSIEISDEEEQTGNFGIDVKVRWISRDVERIQLGMNENFTKIFKYFASIANVDENQILITKNGMPISPLETPSSIKLSIIDVLEGGFVKEHMNVEKIEDNLPKCKIKVQSSLKKFWTFELNKDEKFQKIFEHCAKENNVPISQLKYFFDGESISPSDTPDDLDLDDEACFDLKIIS